MVFFEKIEGDVDEGNLTRILHKGIKVLIDSNKRWANPLQVLLFQARSALGSIMPRSGDRGAGSVPGPAKTWTNQMLPKRDGAVLRRLICDAEIREK